MNARRRKILEKLQEMLQILLDEELSEIREVLEAVKEEESEAQDNLPESLQESELYYKLDNSITCLEDALESLEYTEDYINEVQEKLEEAMEG